MPWRNHVHRLIGMPVGVSLINGQGVSGLLCDVRGDMIYLLEYLYRDQFATKHYNFRTIQNIVLFPPCERRPAPPPMPPRPRLY